MMVDLKSSILTVWLMISFSLVCRPNNLEIEKLHFKKVEICKNNESLGKVQDGIQENLQRLICMGSFENCNVVDNTHMPGVLRKFILKNSKSDVQENETPILESANFRFYSDYWINLHHFLYEKASGGQSRKLKEDDLYFLDINEEDVYSAIPEKDREILNNAVAYYKNNLIDKSLLFDLADQRKWLQERNSESPIADSSFGQEFTDVLNAVSPVYKKWFWELHNDHNEKMLRLHFNTVKKVEKEVLSRIQKKIGYPFPKKKIRIDLTAYGNWAGAYTQALPNPNITISTLDALTEGTAFIEMVFHEVTHLILSNESAIMREIKKSMTELEIKDNRLWHAIQFYICGRVVQDELKNLDKKHELVMITKRISQRYNTDAFRATLDSFLNDEMTREAAVRQLVMALKQ